MGAHHDPTVNQTTGQPCKGKIAACVLRDVLRNPEVLAFIERTAPELADDIVSALAPFNGRVLPPTREVLP